MYQAIAGLCSRPWLSYLSSASGTHHRHRVVPPLAVCFRAHALRPTDKGSAAAAAEEEEGEEEEVVGPKKSRNEKKREARRAVKWGMELANLAPPQIKRVLSVASLDDEVFDALMLVKRLGPDVREGKRRQFSYIGRLLRSVQPELMEALIQASKDGDNSRLISLSGQETFLVDHSDEEEEEEEEEDIIYDKKEGDNHIELASRWFDGLIEKDPSITNEVYAIYNVEFDRQELRRLVRRVQTVQKETSGEEKEAEMDSTLTTANKHLVRFLRSLAKRSLTA